MSIKSELISNIYVMYYGYEDGKDNDGNNEDNEDSEDSEVEDNNISHSNEIYIIEKIVDGIYLKYKLINDLSELQRGQNIRWINKNNDTRGIELLPKLTKGGTLVDILFENSGVNLLCKLNTNRFIKIKFNNCILFQKYTEAEWYSNLYESLIH